MGLEYTELLLRLEDTFNLEIEDDLAEIQTVGDLYLKLMTTLQARPHRPCRTSTTFFAIRNKIIDIAGVARSDLSLSTPLRQVLTIRQRKKLWHEAERDRSLRLPPLQTVVPGWFVFLFSVVSGMTIAFYLTTRPAYVNLLVLIGCLGFIVFPIIIGMPLQRALNFSFPNSCRSIHDLVAATVNNTYGPSGWPSDVVWQELREAVAEVWQADPERVQPDLRLEDLG